MDVLNEIADISRGNTFYRFKRPGEMTLVREPCIIGNLRKIQPFSEHLLATLNPDLIQIFMGRQPGVVSKHAYEMILGNPR